MATLTYTTRDGLARQHELGAADAGRLAAAMDGAGAWFRASDGWRLNLAEVLTARIDGEPPAAEPGMEAFRRVAEHLRDLACLRMAGGYDAQLACMDIDRLAEMHAAALAGRAPEGGEA